jgi:NADH-quinone oxidoreductase subunit J
MMHQLIFLYFAVVILTSAVLMITRRNPIHSVMFMLLLFFHIAGLFVMLNAEFLAAVQLIVYAGAIMILYLFVAMLLHVTKEAASRRANRFWPWIVAFGVMVAGEVIVLVMRGSFPADAGDVAQRGPLGIKELGVELFQKYLVPFEVASVILLVGLVGAVMLAKRQVTEHHAEHRD